MAHPSNFRALRVHVEDEGINRCVEEVAFDALPEHAISVKVAYSSLNYKDALSASGHKGVTKRYPHTPGIDAAGVVVSSSDPRYQEGDEVIVTGFDLGMDTPGGFGEYIRVPTEWLVPLPEGLNLKEAMVYGTAGLTAAMAVEALLGRGLTPPSPVLVTGASGGVGSFSVALLSKLGFTVVASSGKRDAHALLRELGASETIGRDELVEPSPKPLLPARWAGAIDTVGGRALETVVKSLQVGGAVAACGNVAGAELSLTVYPFILRGAALLGIDSQHYPLEKRVALWRKLANEWRLELPNGLVEVVTLDGLEEKIEAILRGEVRGRVVVEVAGG
jgi:acrylyl-CoA reductase (NADPH)